MEESRIASGEIVDMHAHVYPEGCFDEVLKAGRSSPWPVRSAACRSPAAAAIPCPHPWRPIWTPACRPWTRPASRLRCCPSAPSTPDGPARPPPGSSTTVWPRCAGNTRTVSASSPRCRGPVPPRSWTNWTGPWVWAPWEPASPPPLPITRSTPRAPGILARGPPAPPAGAGAPDLPAGRSCQRPGGISRRRLPRRDRHGRGQAHPGRRAGRMPRRPRRLVPLRRRPVHGAGPHRPGLPPLREVPAPPEQNTCRQCYYDTVTGSGPALDCARATFGADRLVYGTDEPHVPNARQGRVGRATRSVLAGAGVGDGSQWQRLSAAASCLSLPNTRGCRLI